MVVSQAKLIKTIIKNDGHQLNSAKELGIRQSSIHGRLARNPHLKKIILNAREQALKESGLTRPRIYRKISNHLDAKLIVVHEGKAIRTNQPDYVTQDKAITKALNLHRDLKDADNETPVSSIGTLVFNILMNNKREAIEVV